MVVYNVYKHYIFSVDEGGQRDYRENRGNVSDTYHGFVYIGTTNKFNAQQLYVASTHFPRYAS